MQSKIDNLFMIHKKDVKDKVRILRGKGFSLNQIAEKTKVPKSTVRTWIQDVLLSENQKKFLKQRTQNALQNGRIKFQKLNKEKREIHGNYLFKEGIGEIGGLNNRDLFLSGISLYWAEGFKNKHEHRLGFCNTDPFMIKFYIYWLEKCLGVNKNKIVARLALNVSYKDKTEEIQAYWANMIGIDLSQFTKPFYQTSKWKKKYNVDNYHGVLRIHVKGSLDHLLKMKGWIEGMKMNVVE